MVLDTIYVTRHAHRSNWDTADSPKPTPHPSGVPPPDTPLSLHGEQQASELAAHVLTLDPPVDVIYSSPFYRCLQTVEPVAAALGVEVRGEAGLGEWYGTSRLGLDPKPSPPQQLRNFFPTYSLAHTTLLTPPTAGETIAELHDRMAVVMAGIIEQLDSDPAGPRAVLICTHAAGLLALGRVLVGRMPGDVSEGEFGAWVAGLSTFRRRGGGEHGLVAAGVDKETEEWRDGSGVGGGWDCVVNGDCSYLSGGEERGWRFSGRESFSDVVRGHGVDAGTGLGAVVEGRKR